MSDTPLAGRTIFMSGGSRGIGEAIAVRCARDGANVVIAAKSDEPHPKLPGTIHTAAAAVEEAGGQALPLKVDIRDEDAVADAVAQAVDRFGGIDVVVNNASAIKLLPTSELSVSRYDLMHQINGRGTFVVTKACLPHLRESDRPHVLTLSPPVSLDPKWWGAFGPYVLTKVSMSLFTLAWAEEWREHGIGVNSLWPRTAIATAAVEHEIGGEEMMRASRTVEIMADAAHVLLSQDPTEVTGNFFIDDELLASEGITDLSAYQAGEGEPLVDLFLDG